MDKGVMHCWRRLYVGREDLRVLPQVMGGDQDRRNGAALRPPLCFSSCFAKNKPYFHRLTRCFSPRVIESAIADTDEASLIRRVISQVTKAMNSIAFARAMPELLTVVSALFLNLRYKQGPLR